MKIKIIKITLVLLFGMINVANAVQNIAVYGGNSGKTKLAISGISEPEILQEMNFDLTASGEIAIENLDSIEKLLKSNASYQLKADIKPQDDRKILTYYLKQNFTDKILLKNKLSFNNSNQRKVIHMMNDEIYQAIMHTPAAFTSKIAVIIKNNDQYHLVISDYDGYNVKTILRTKTPISSLAWSHDNNNLAYVFYGASKPVVYTQNLSTGSRTLVSAFDGSNSSPVFVNNNKLVVTLSKDEGSHLYMIDNSPYLDSKSATPLMRYGDIDTEADLTSDGKLIFTSDREGEPQIYITDLSTKTPTKLTDLIGHHLTTARFSQDGNKVVLINKESGFKTFYYDITEKTISCISEGNSDIAPSFSPNNKLVLYSSNDSLYISSIVHNKISAISLQNMPYDEIIDQRWSN